MAFHCAQADMQRQFVVEVDFSDIDLGVILSQQDDENGWLYPCAFFSQRLAATENIKPNVLFLAVS